METTLTEISPTGFLRRIADSPELNVAIFALLLNFPWELLQAPLFAGLATAPHWQAVKTCAVATMGDAAIMLTAFWSVALMARSRHWLARPKPLQMIAFVLVGLGITVAIEFWATEVAGRWTYAKAMPVIPALGVGLAPMIQWLTLPLLVVWFVRRQVTWAKSSWARGGPEPAECQNADCPGMRWPDCSRDGSGP